MKNNTFVHKYIKGLNLSNSTCTDMTVGNGNDTYLLCDISKEVIGFDINDLAITNTKERCKEFHNLTLINDNHIHVDKYIQKKVKLFIFNLGYLPNSLDKTITKADETLVAFKKAYELLEDNGYIIITFYIGHIGGKAEYYLIDDYIIKHNIKVIEKYKEYKKVDEPITYIIKK